MRAHLLGVWLPGEGGREGGWAVLEEGSREASPWEGVLGGNAAPCPWEFSGRSHTQTTSSRAEPGGPGKAFRRKQNTHTHTYIRINQDIYQEKIECKKVNYCV